MYTDVWLSVGDPKEERARRRKALKPYQVDGHLMALARDDAVFMHCLPAHRGEPFRPESVHRFGEAARSLVSLSSLDAVGAARAVDRW